MGHSIFPHGGQKFCLQDTASTRMRGQWKQPQIHVLRLQPTITSSLLLSLLIGKNLLEARKPSFHVAVWCTELTHSEHRASKKRWLHWEVGQMGDVCHGKEGKGDSSGGSHHKQNSWEVENDQHTVHTRSNDGNSCLALVFIVFRYSKD